MSGILAKAFRRLRAYWSLTKSLQTGLLLITGLAGYMSARCPITTWQTLLALSGSLFLAIGGSTVLNMVYDRDIDAVMRRTCWRPLPVGLVSVREALGLGLALTIAGVAWALYMSLAYGLVVLAGVFFDAVIYTIWLKRRTPWAILWGGIAGGMPVLAGRVLALGRLDLVGVLLALSVLFWIPTHIMTFSLKYADDYARAGIPTFPARYGVQTTRAMISIASIAAPLTMLLAVVGIGMAWGYLGLLAILGLGLLLLAIINFLRPSDRLNHGLFRYASLYMFTSMLLVILETL